MKYYPKFIENATIEELKYERDLMYDRQYQYGYSIDYPRMWDIEYTIRLLQEDIL